MYLSTFCFVVIAAVAVYGTSCSKYANRQINNAGITGSWEWIRTDGGIGAHIHETPSSTGKNIELKMEADQQYFVLTNGILTSQGTYLLETRKCIHDHTNKTFINFSAASEKDMMVEKVGQDSLELSDETYDGIESVYKRKGQQQK